MAESPADRSPSTDGEKSPAPGRDTESAAGEGPALVRLGVRFGFLTPEAGEQALAAWEEGERSRSMADILSLSRLECRNSTSRRWVASSTGALISLGGMPRARSVAINVRCLTSAVVYTR